MEAAKLLLPCFGLPSSFGACPAHSGGALREWVHDHATGYMSMLRICSSYPSLQHDMPDDISGLGEFRGTDQYFYARVFQGSADVGVHPT